MNILVINCGSSSLKYQLINMKEEKVYAKGICERIGIEGSRLKHTPFNKETIIIESTIMKAVKMVLDAQQKTTELLKVWMKYLLLDTSCSQWENFMICYYRQEVKKAIERQQLAPT